jgi:cis-3-alkyl-4-acyloxetan-2-one decarboxylase
MAFDLKKLYPFAGRYLDMAGIRLHYLDEGEGEPVVMLHGNPTWSFFYRNLVLALRDRYRCIVPDHMGCGLSDKPGDDRYPYTLERRVADLSRLIESLGIDSGVTLVLHDWGGMIGMAWAAKNPDLVKKLVIMNTAAFHLPREKTFPLPLRICRGTLLGALLVRGFNAFSLAASFVGCKRNPMPAELRRAYRFPYDSWQNRIATLRFVQDIPMKEGDRGHQLVSYTESRLHLFQSTPMAIFWGELDFVFDRIFLNEWQRRFPHAEVHSYPDAGHYILEDAKDEVIPLIADFIGRG